MRIQNLSILTLPTLHSAAVAAGQTDITPSTPISMNDGAHEGCLFYVLFGAITAGGVQSVEIHSSATSGGTYAIDAAGSAVVVADTDDNKIVVCEIYRPTNPFLKCIVKRATQDSAINGILAIQYGGRRPNQTPGSTIAGRSASLGGTEITDFEIT